MVTEENLIYRARSMSLKNKNQQSAVNIKIGFPAVLQKQFSLTVLWLILLLTVVGTAGYFYQQYRSAQLGAAEAKETKALVETISNLMLLPEGEEPTLATVTDKEKLDDQPFFQKAENGDKILIYSNSGSAVLYRPSLKKIIDVTTVNTTLSGSTSPSTSPSEIKQSENTPISTSIRVAIYNATIENGAASLLEKQIKELYPDMTIPVKMNATKLYEQSIVVDLTGKNSIIAQAFANLVHGNIGALPSGEKAPVDVDALIIIGKAH